MEILSPALLIAVLAIGTTSPATAKHRHTPLASQAKISMATAKATALARVPRGTIRSSELEREHGKLIYSFDIKVPGRSGIEEVNVNAIDGIVVAVAHEGVKKEKAEAKQEKAAAGKTK